MRVSNCSITSSGKPFGKVGQGRSRMTPMSSQCPVTESLPDERSAMRPKAAVGDDAGGWLSPTSLDMPIAASVGMFRGTEAAMLPRVLLPWSSYSAASGSSPMPTLSSTMTIARLNTTYKAIGRRQKAEVNAFPFAFCLLPSAFNGPSSGMMGREVVGNAARGADGRDRVLEDQVIHARVLDDQSKPIEILDARFEFTPVEQVHGHGELLPSRVIQEHVLNIRRAGLRFRYRRHVFR